MTVMVVPTTAPGWSAVVALLAASSCFGKPCAAGSRASLATRRRLLFVRSLPTGTRCSPPRPNGSGATLFVAPPREAPTGRKARPANHEDERRGCQDPITRRSAMETVASVVSIAAGVSATALPLPTALAGDLTHSGTAGPGTSNRMVTGDKVGVAGKPYAPLEALLPATRVRVLIDEAVDAARALTKLQGDEADAADGESTARPPGVGASKGRTDGDGPRAAALIAELRGFLLEPRQFVADRGGQLPPQRTSRGTWRDWSRARRSEAREALGMVDDDAASFVPSLAVRANEEFEQWGERRQWARLKRRQRSLEVDDPIRAAFNAYTDRLVFGESYALNASGEERSRLLRTYDRLPDVTSVIRSDLDLRDLYRNQVLTAMDDARAELVYQTEKSEGGLDATDLLDILLEAQSSCLEWFNFVPANDVNDALNAVKHEKE